MDISGRARKHRFVATAGRGHIGSWTQRAVDTSGRGHSGPWTHRVVDTALDRGHSAMLFSLTTTIQMDPTLLKLSALSIQSMDAIMRYRNGRHHCCRHHIYYHHPTKYVSWNKDRISQNPRHALVQGRPNLLKTCDQRGKTSEWLHLGVTERKGIWKMYSSLKDRRRSYLPFRWTIFFASFSAGQFQEIRSWRHFSHAPPSPPFPFKIGSEFINIVSVKKKKKISFYLVLLLQLFWKYFLRQRWHKLLNWCSKALGIARFFFFKVR